MEVEKKTGTPMHVEPILAVHDISETILSAVWFWAIFQHGKIYSAKRN
jgi:hypothetical protein